MSPRLLRSAIVELIRIGLTSAPHLRAEAEGLLSLSIETARSRAGFYGAREETEVLQSLLRSALTLTR